MSFPDSSEQQNQNPSLRSEFGSASLPEEAALRFGGRRTVSGTARTYAFSRFDRQEAKPGSDSAPAGGTVVPEPLELPDTRETAPAYAAEFARSIGSVGQTAVGSVYEQTAPGELYETPDPAGWEEAPPEEEPEPARSAAVRRTTTVRGGPWVAIAVVAALLLGLAVGAFGYRLWRDGVLGFGPTPEGGESGKESSGLTPTEIYETCGPSVVGITAVPFSVASDASHEPAAVAGTGFLISEDGYLLTNYHVVRGALELRIRLWDGRECKARLVSYESQTSDLALLKIEETGLQSAALGDSGKLRVGERVCTVGNPFGELSYSLTVGYISALDRTISADGGSIRVLQTDTAINNGSSGGPLFDGEGKVIGIVTAKYNGSGEPEAASVEGLGFAIPINDAKTLAETWIRNDRQAKDS